MQCAVVCKCNVEMVGRGWKCLLLFLCVHCTGCSTKLELKPFATVGRRVRPGAVIAQGKGASDDRYHDWYDWYKSHNDKSSGYSTKLGYKPLTNVLRRAMPGGVVAQGDGASDDRYRDWYNWYGRRYDVPSGRYGGGRSARSGHVRRMVARSSVGRLAFLRGAAAVLLAAAPWAPSQPANADVTEEIRKAASLVPGYGPPDLLYPPAFRGRWRVTRTVVDVAFPLGKDKAPVAEAAIAERQAAGAPASFEVRFVETNDGAENRVVPDRAFNAEQREAALLGVPIGDLEASWSANNPNVVTMRNGKTGSVVETKVTKRSVETPGVGAFGTSEYARVADAGSSGVLGGVPRILATRERARWRYEGERPARIDGLELSSLYDPTQTGFADLAGASPVMTVKARLALERSR